MALETCYECNGQVSERAAVCPSCGSPRGAGAASRMTITDFDMPFWSMVGLMVKVAFAAIPAMIVIGVVWLIIVAVFAAIARG